MTRSLKLDHLIYAVPDLAIAIDDFERRLGLAPFMGGRHKGLGTHNAILPLVGETYVELIAIDRDGPTPNQPRPFGLDALQEPRLVTWAVRSRAIEADVEHARERDFDPGLILAMTREEPSGEVLRWRLTLRSQPFGDGLVPFVIDWASTPHPATQADSEAPHCSLSSFEAFHPDPASLQIALVALQTELEIGLAAEPSLKAHLAGPTGSLILS